MAAAVWGLFALAIIGGAYESWQDRPSGDFEIAPASVLLVAEELAVLRLVEDGAVEHPPKWALGAAREPRGWRSRMKRCGMVATAGDADFAPGGINGGVSARIGWDSYVREQQPSTRSKLAVVLTFRSD